MTFNELKILDFTLSLPWWLGYVIIKVPLNRKHKERKKDRLDDLKKELRETLVLVMKIEVLTSS